MAFLDTKQDRAAFLIFVLGLGLVWALWPFSTGLIGAPVLYVVFAPVHRWLAKQINPKLAAGLVVLLGIILVIGPGAAFVGVIANEAQDIAGGVIRSPLLTRLRELRVGPYDIGAQIGAAGSRLVALDRLQRPGADRHCHPARHPADHRLLRALLPPSGAEDRLEGASAVHPVLGQKCRTPAGPLSRCDHLDPHRNRDDRGGPGASGGLAFWVTGMPNALFWGVVTVILAILPVVGSGLVWGPGAVALAVEGQTALAIGLALWGVIVVGNVDNIIRPAVFRRWAQIHPFITIIGAFAGINYFGLLGLLIGPAGHLLLLRADPDVQG